MKRSRIGNVLLSVALFAALIAHVVIDVLGDFMLAHDTYDDIDHSSRGIVAIVTLALALGGAAFGLRAALREANGSENAFCCALRSALPRSTLLFTLVAIAASALALCFMEGCDAWLAGHEIDDIGDLFGGSIALGGTTVALIAAVSSVATLAGLRRLARTRLVAGVIGAFLRRCVTHRRTELTDRSGERRRVFHSRIFYRRLAGRAPPPGLLVTTE